MNKGPFTTLIIILLALMFFPACKPNGQPNQVDTPPQNHEPVTATNTRPVLQTVAAVENNLPTVTIRANPTATPLPTSTTEPATPLPKASTEPATQSAFIDRFCPSLPAPAGLFALREPFIVADSNLDTVYTLYQIAELQPEGLDEPCTLYLSPGPMGEPQPAGNSMFWKAYDYDADTVTIWQYDSRQTPSSESYPQHSPLLPTTVNTSLGMAGLIDFIVADDGELLVWSYSEPRVNDENQLAYIQTIYAIVPGEPIDQRPATEIWFDVVPETDGRPHIIRLHHISREKERIYFSDEPVGQGRHWPEPAGVYSSLYSLSIEGDASPLLHYDCGQNYWCISDFSTDLDLLVVIEPDSNGVEIRKLNDGELINQIRLPGRFNLARQALIGPAGEIAVMGVDLEGSIFDGPPTQVAVFTIKPPYTDALGMVVSNPGLLNLLEWESAERILANGHPGDGDPPEGVALPSQLMLINIHDQSGEWLPVDAGGFVSLVP